ncbi:MULTISPECIES: hypothetical protein, partial [unclassified Streptomyces]|uniref:hypothetical protein n=1 Tax=unclassified Streptomyces TaxID=2593676 RepID=UPI00081EEB2C
AGGAPPATRRRPTYTIGLHADLSGPGKLVGVAHLRGAQLAVDGHNARAAAPSGSRCAPRTTPGPPPVPSGSPNGWRPPRR